MPRYPIERSTNFIIEDESWNVIEYDHTSVPGTIYLSLTENKINLIYDDVENKIADTDKLANYRIEAPDTLQIFNVGDVIDPKFTLTKNGAPIDLAVNLQSSDKKIARLVDGNLVAVGEGTVDIVINLVDFPAIQTSIQIRVSSEEKQFLAYIEGKDSIKLDREETYTLQSTDIIDSDVVFTLDETDLASVKAQNNNKCVVVANAANKLGKIVLRANYNDIEYSKEISIIPLW